MLYPAAIIISYFYHMYETPGNTHNSYGTKGARKCRSINPAYFMNDIKTSVNETAKLMEWWQNLVDCGFQ